MVGTGDPAREWTELLGRYAARSVHLTSELVLHSDDALQLIQQATRCGVRVLGVEGFFVEGPYLRAASEWIADYSDATLSVANRAALAFVRSAGAAGAVVVVVFERD